jgi:hypothetical protein
VSMSGYKLRRTFEKEFRGGTVVQVFEEGRVALWRKATWDWARGCLPPDALNAARGSGGLSRQRTSQSSRPATEGSEIKAVESVFRVITFE